MALRLLNIAKAARAAASAVERRLFSSAAGSPIGSPERVAHAFGPIGSDGLPTFVNWRIWGAVPKVENQGACGSCWAFATKEAVQSINAIRDKKLLTLSAQHLLDCVDVRCRGCKGGSVTASFDYIIANGGLVTEDDYPYMGYKMPYKDITAYAVSIDQWQYGTDVTEDQLKYVVSKQPVCAVVGADAAFVGYRGGVKDGPNYTLQYMRLNLRGPGTRIGHWVTIVGYGVLPNGRKFWLIKNSWGVGWGEKGYGLLARDTGKIGGAFGICRFIAFPLKWSPNGVCTIRSEFDMGIPRWYY